jgi:hypothetical protein
MPVKAVVERLSFCRCWVSNQHTSHSSEASAGSVLGCRPLGGWSHWLPTRRGAPVNPGEAGVAPFGGLTDAPRLVRL